MGAYVTVCVGARLYCVGVSIDVSEGEGEGGRGGGRVKECKKVRDKGREGVRE